MIHEQWKEELLMFYCIDPQGVENSSASHEG